MARLEADLSFFMMASDYNPAHYDDWTEKELSALGDCRATAEVIKRRLEDNGTKVKEMYVVEHTSEAKANSQAKEYHPGTDETERHYHILTRFEPTHGATLKEIAEYIGVPPEVIVKPKAGRYSYNNNLAYLTHIKYKNKIQYAPEDIVTLAGTDYMDYFNHYKASWTKARDIVAKKGGKPLKRIFHEAIVKMEQGEITYEELRSVNEYRKLLLEPKYKKQLEQKGDCICALAYQDHTVLEGKIANNEITSLDEIIESDDWRLAYKYHQEEIIKEMSNQKSKILIHKIENHEITSLAEIRAEDGWILAYKHNQADIELKLAEKNDCVLLDMIERKEITSLAEIRENEDLNLVYNHHKNRYEIDRRIWLLSRDN